MKPYQIGVMGSAADLKYSKEIGEIAKEIGREIALKGGILFFGAEKDSDSLSTCAFRGAMEEGGTTVGITYGKGQGIWNGGEPTIIIPCGLERGGGRELTLVLSCDAVISISGGSGTLTELAIAYQANIPTIVMQGFGGWSDKLAGTYLDNRERQLFMPATSPKEAVDLAFLEAEKYRNRNAKAPLL
ncbi:MAG: hypothetical protein LBL47_04050 [Lactobacillus sp.]|jgi:uncharacterized protein (TIGR00725 family)|nr:hypothetical protein [Lactobacillus sp.]